MNLKNRQQLLVILVGVAVGLLVMDRIIISTLAGSWKGRATRIADLERSVSQGALLLDRERTIQERWKRMEAGTLPVNASTAENDLLKSFDRWSQASRISISSIKPQWKRAGETYATLECRADAFGSIQALTRFLYEVEKDPLALKVESIEVTARDDNGEQLTLGLHVSGLQLDPPTQ